MDPIKDLQIGVTTGVLERLRSPLIGSFVISWCLYNWEIFLILAAFSDSVEYRINAIRELISVQYSFAVPITFAVAYFFVAPWLWLLLRRYSQLPEDRLRRTHRLQREDNLIYENSLAEKETKLLLLRQQKLQSEKEISLIREKINSYFDQAFETAQSSYQAKLDLVLLNVEQLERDVLPRLNETLSRKMEDYEKLRLMALKVPRASLETRPISTKIEANNSSSQHSISTHPNAQLASAMQGTLNSMETPKSSEPPYRLIDPATLRALQETVVEEVDIPAFLRKNFVNSEAVKTLEALDVLNEVPKKNNTKN